MESVITHPESDSPSAKRLKYLFALASFVTMSIILIQKVDFPSMNPFNDPPQTAGVAALNPNADQSVNDVVTAALAFKALLTTTQQATLQQTYTTTLARKWSNLPCGSTCRNGIQFGSLTTAQQTAATAIIQAALGSGTNNGSDEWNSIRVAEDWLGANGGGTSQYNSGLRWIAFLNVPSTTGAWMLQFGGHHYAANIAFNNGHVIGATPMFVALEPTTFTYNGTTYAPMEDERTALRNMLASLTSTQFNTAKLSTTFSDCLMSPGESNGNTNTMPATKQGVACSTMTTAQQDLVLAAIGNYVNDLDATTAASLMALYTSEISSTYVAFTGSATVGSASTFLSSNSNYVRIDGPHVWIEFACQNGVVVSSQIHYHSVWRDHSSDYGADLAGSSIDNLGISNVASTVKIKAYPNPAIETISADFATGLSNAKATVFDLSGRKLISSKFSGTQLKLNVASLSQGNYILSVEDGSRKFTAKFIKK
ncbi:MAG: DUF3500 domain-containing protein [Flavobacterium sp.]